MSQVEAPSHKTVNLRQRKAVIEQWAILLISNIWPLARNKLKLRTLHARCQWTQLLLMLVFRIIQRIFAFSESFNSCHYNGSRNHVDAR
jgi:hypothetical protein